MSVQNLSQPAAVKYQKTREETIKIFIQSKLLSILLYGSSPVFCLFRRSKWDLIWDYSPKANQHIRRRASLFRTTSNDAHRKLHSFFIIIFHQRAKSRVCHPLRQNHIITDKIQFVNRIGWLRFKPPQLGRRLCGGVLGFVMSCNFSKLSLD